VSQCDPDEHAWFAVGSQAANLTGLPVDKYLRSHHLRFSIQGRAEVAPTGHIYLTDDGLADQ